MEDTKEQVRENQKQRDLEKDRDQADFREVMRTEAGRRVIHRLLERAGIYRSSFTGQSNQTIFNEGNRNQGLQLLSDVMAFAPGSYELMMKENRDEQQ
jgi:hypothetical protein